MAFRLPFRLTPRSAIELSIATLFALIGLILLLGTLDEFKAGRAFNRAMDSYVAGEAEDLRDHLDDAIAAKPAYDAPQEAVAKLRVDEGKLDEAVRMYERLQRRQEAGGGKASLPVLIGLAVAPLEAARASAASPEALREARTRLEAALAAYPDSGDVHVNLATVALLEGDAARCRAEMDQVEAVGNISPDALPVLYNLAGLLALREQRFDAAALEFEKVKEFRPDWEVPKLNLAAAHAQTLNTPSADPRLADRAANALRRVLPEIRKSRGPLYSLICQAVGTYSLLPHGLLKPQTGEALRLFAEAEKLAKLPWQTLFNRAVAQYLEVHAARHRTPGLFDTLAAHAQALTPPKAAPRDRFAASCILGTIEHGRGNAAKALEHFTAAAALAEKANDPFIRSAMPRAMASLVTLYYEAGDLPKAAECLKKAEALAGPEEQKSLSALAKLLRGTPVIQQFEWKQEKLFTEADLRVTATLFAPGSPKPLTPGNVTLTLTDDLGKTSRPLPFQLNGPNLCGVAVNLPQGRYRVQLTVTDPFGNRAEAAGEPIEIDREPPLVTGRVPDAGATVASVKAIEFRIEDALSGVDLEAVRVSLRYPPGSTVGARTLVAGGKVLFASADGSIPRNAAVTANVRAPLPPDKLLQGDYRAVVHVRDTRGKARDVEWTFHLAP
jgi:tetratricopeptide (TPR) repeat protein